MKATTDRRQHRSRVRRFAAPRIDDPRVVRTRAAVVEAARTLFLRDGHAGTTMAAIAAMAGITKRTLYNNYPDKDALFVGIVSEVIGYAEAYARALRRELVEAASATDARAVLREVGVRLAIAIVRPDVVALRRLLIGEARDFPDLARAYYSRAPGRVLAALAAGFRAMAATGALRVTDARIAASQFAYLVAGEALDRAVLVGTVPSRERLVAVAGEGVETFLARYAPPLRG